MDSHMRSGRRLDDQKLSLFAALMLLISVGGCSGTQSADQALNKALANAGQQREKIYPLAGTVTIDGQSPHFDKPAYKLTVILNDPQSPDAPIRERPYVVADSHGGFAFETYFNGDGVKPGKYILTFAVLRKKSKTGYVGPDQLKNLYNGPDQNSTAPDFVIDHQAPGKTDYTFNLAIAGKEAAKPGPHALTEILWSR
jgi:hypothetical protein